MKLKYEETTYKIIGAAMRVHAKFGSGFQEVIYQRALATELEEIKMIFQREFTMPIKYKKRQIGARRVDFLIDGKISLEIKAITKLEKVHIAQALNYLEVYNLETGLLINFGSESLEYRRLINNKFDPNLAQV